MLDSKQSTYLPKPEQATDAQGSRSSEPSQNQQYRTSQFLDPANEEAVIKQDHGAPQTYYSSQSEGHLPNKACVLPSQLLGSYQIGLPPQAMYAEDPCYMRQSPLGSDALLYSYGIDNSPDLNFAKTANDMINKALDRTPGGNSVVEPDSVLGESGRLYHGYKEGKYFLPNDAAEQDRLDFQHRIFEILFDGWLALAPLANPPRYVLDIGTGTGLWATDFAEQNPSSYVIGTDLSAIQPETHLPNCSFVKDDAELPWYFPESNPDHTHCSQNCEHFISFDYVHLRMMFTCFEDTRNVMRNAYENMLPGGWIEFQDSALKVFQANPAFEGDAVIRYGQACIQGAALKGRDIMKSEKYEEWLKEVGFVDVTVRKFLWPVNPWPEHPKLKKIGEYNIVNAIEGVKGIGWKMLTAAGMTPAEVDQLVEDIKIEVRNPNNHSYTHIWVVYGRKPFAYEIATHEASSGSETLPPK